MQQTCPPNGRNGSGTTDLRWSRDVRFSPESDRSGRRFSRREGHVRVVQGEQFCSDFVHACLHCPGKCNRIGAETNMRRYCSIIWFLFAVAALAMPVVATAQIINITIAPPELPVYEQPAIPAPGYMWSPGYWAYGPDGYFWVPGT
jgi:hypothetical protein